MSVTQVTDLTALPPALVAQFRSSLTQLIQEYNPNIDLKSGVYSDQILGLMSILQAADQQNINLVVQSSSLAQIIANPTLADPTVVSNLLSNFNIVASPGVKATGNVTFVLSALVGVVIPAGTILTINGLTFNPTNTFAARTTSGAVLAATDVLITSIGGGQYAFTIPVIATAVGTAYNVTKGSAATLSSNPPSFVKAYATSDFTGGLNAQTNSQLLTLLAQGLAIKAWSNRVSDEALIRAQPAFANIQALSIIGFGDAEMIRDQHSIFPGSFGGRNDAYILTQSLFQTYSFPVTATLISKVGATGTWQFAITKNQAPGFYQVTGVLLPSQNQNTAGFQPISDVRGYDLTGVAYAPDIKAVVEAVYSRYQTAVIQFVDTVTNATSLSIGHQQAYNCVVQLMPLIAQIQDFLGGRTVAPPMCDVLVKAPIPAFTSLSFTLNYTNGTTAPVVASVQTAVASVVNALSFPGTLSASFISQVVHNAVPNLVSVTNLSLVTQIREPNGHIITLSSATALSVPNDYPNMLSGRTCVFFLPPASVGVTLVAVDVPNV